MSRRWVGLAALAAMMVGSLAAQAHFVFIVPEAGEAAVKVVFSDTLEPDLNVNIEKIGGAKLYLRDASGQDQTLEWKKQEGYYHAAVSGQGLRVVYGVHEYGVVQKGDAKPFRLVYYPKAILGPATQPQATIGEKLPLEIVAEGKPGAVRFRVLFGGKPLPEADVTVLLPGGGKKVVQTDKEGYTPAFDATGRYGLYTRRIEAKDGEYAGRSYNEVRYYATLVCDIKD